MLGALALLAGCAVPEVKGLVHMPGTRIAVQALPEGGGHEVVVGESLRLALAEHRAARIEGVWAVGAHRLAVIDGATAACPARPYLVVAREAEGSLRPLGRCGDKFAFNWSAEQFTARQVNARDPMVWSFRDGVLSGPVAQSVLNRRGRPAVPERPAEAGEPNGREVTPQRDPIAVPPISRPVGEDVIPPPVGGGPLPSRPPPRVF